MIIRILFSKFEETKLPPKYKFYSILNDSDIQMTIINMLKMFLKPLYVKIWKIIIVFI